MIYMFNYKKKLYFSNKAKVIIYSQNLHNIVYVLNYKYEKL